MSRCVALCIDVPSLSIRLNQSARFSVVAPVKKITITPVYGLANKWHEEPFDSRLLPYHIANGVYLEDIREKMQTADFELWRKEFLSKKDVEELKSWSCALVHVYEAEEHLQSHPEKESKELVHKIFLGLRIVRPSRQPYSSLQAKLVSNNGIEPFTFSHPEPLLLVPESESLNALRNRDASELRAIVPTLLRAYEQSCVPILRAIRNLEVGYVSQFPDVQHLLWVTGLDSLCTSREWKHRGSWVATERIKAFLGAEYRIYKDGDLPSYLATPTATVTDMVMDVYKIRNFFAHGEWPGPEWIEKPFRDSFGDKTVSYTDALREAASVLLRSTLHKILREDLLDTFGDKNKMNNYFERLGLVRERK